MIQTAWIAFGLTLCLQDETELKRGERFLTRAAEAWRKASSIEERLGIFVGRRWIGEAILKARPTNEGFQIEVSSKHELGGSKFDMELRLDATDTLKPVKSTTRILIDLLGNKSRVDVTLTHKEGVVEGTVDEDGEKRDWKEKIGPAGAIPQPLLLFLARHLDPKDHERIALFQFGNKAIRTTIIGVGPQKVRIGGRELDCSMMNIESGEEHYVAYFDAASQTFLEIRRTKGEGILRYRPIKPDEAGKNLNEPQDLSDPEKVYVEFGWAVQKRDAAALKSLIDFERMTKETLSDFNTLSKERKQEYIQLMRESVLEALTGKDMPSVPGFSDVLEAADSNLFETRIQDREAVVRFKYKGSFSLNLHRVGEGKDERWLVFKIK